MADDTPPLTWDWLLAAYANGYFPMAKSKDDETLYWFYPKRRGIIPLPSFHLPRSLIKFMGTQPFEITADRAFPRVIRACADRPESWINAPIIRLYGELWEMGFGHSIECWRDGELVGGIYGIAIGGAFFAESMFSRVSGASKVALATLMQRLSDSGYELLDTQYINPHLLQFGAVEISRRDYLKQLARAMEITPTRLDTFSD